MLITIDKQRLLHLSILLTTTLVGGFILTHFYEWGRLSAYGLTCTLSCQVSDAILKIKEEQRKIKQEEESTEKRRLKKQEKEKEKGLAGAGSNPKKKKRRNVNAFASSTSE